MFASRGSRVACCFGLRCYYYVDVAMSKPIAFTTTNNQQPTTRINQILQNWDVKTWASQLFTLQLASTQSCQHGKKRGVHHGCNRTNWIAGALSKTQKQSNIYISGPNDSKWLYSTVSSLARTCEIIRFSARKLQRTEMKWCLAGTWHQTPKNACVYVGVYLPLVYDIWYTAWHDIWYIMIYINMWYLFCIAAVWFPLSRDFAQTYGNFRPPSFASPCGRSPCSNPWALPALTPVKRDQAPKAAQKNKTGSDQRTICMHNMCIY